MVRGSGAPLSWAVVLRAELTAAGEVALSFLEFAASAPAGPAVLGRGPHQPPAASVQQRELPAAPSAPPAPPSSRGFHLLSFTMVSAARWILGRHMLLRD